MESSLLNLYSEVKSEPVEWLWSPYIAVGKITLIQGGLVGGKSTMMMNIIARISKGGSSPDVTISSMSLVNKDILESGVKYGGIPAIKIR